MAEEEKRPPRTATVSHDGDGEPLGIAIFLSADELDELGVDADLHNQVKYSIVDGELQLGADPLEE